MTSCTGNTKYNRIYTSTRVLASLGHCHRHIGYRSYHSPSVQTVGDQATCWYGTRKIRRGQPLKSQSGEISRNAGISPKYIVTKGISPLKHMVGISPSEYIIHQLVPLIAVCCMLHVRCRILSPRFYHFAHIGVPSFISRQSMMFNRLKDQRIT